MVHLISSRSSLVTSPPAAAPPHGGPPPHSTCHIARASCCTSPQRRGQAAHTAPHSADTYCRRSLRGCVWSSLMRCPGYGRRRRAGESHALRPFSHLMTGPRRRSYSIAASTDLSRCRSKAAPYARSPSRCYTRPSRCLARPPAAPPSYTRCEVASSASLKHRDNASSSDGDGLGSRPVPFIQSIPRRAPPRGPPPRAPPPPPHQPPSHQPPPHQPPPHQPPSHQVVGDLARPCAWRR